MTKSLLRAKIYNHLRELVAADGIYASGREEIYGCIFGRDSAISILKIIKACSNRSRTFDLDSIELLAACRKTLLTLCSLQGKEINPDSGEEPGKFIHEFRTSNFEHLISGDNPWYVYPDGNLRNYDSLDSTPLGLIAIYKYFKKTRDLTLIYEILPNIKRGLNWITKYGDRDGDFLLEYGIPEGRKHGGLTVHSWTDSRESLLASDGGFPEYPIAPVEVQGYAWLALKVWAKFFRTHKDLSPASDYSIELRRYAMALKRSFNKHFIFKSDGLYYAAQALDGKKKRIETVTGNPLLLLWATYKINGKPYSIIKRRYIPDMIKRAFMSDMFECGAGVRTMSAKSPTFNPEQNSYHNGSFWPKLNGMAYEGLVIWKYYHEAKKLRSATLAPIKHFGTPIELYTIDHGGNYLEFKGANGQVSCRNQAWSAAAVLDILTERNLKH